jgi:hypothetical protein
MHKRSLSILLRDALFCNSCDVYWTCSLLSGNWFVSFHQGLFAPVLANADKSFSIEYSFDVPANGWPITRLRWAGTNERDGSDRKHPQTYQNRPDSAGRVHGRVGRLVEGTHAGGLRADYARTEAGTPRPLRPPTNRPPTQPPQRCQPHAGGTDLTQPPRRRAGRANRCETRATPSPPTPYKTAPPAYYQKTQPGHNGAAIHHFLMARDARHAIATNAGRQTFGLVYGVEMAAQRVAHKLPPGAPKNQ